MKVSYVDIIGLGLGMSIYSKTQIEEFVQFQDSQNARRVYLVEKASVSRTLPRIRWWMLWGYHLVTLYQLVGPTAVIIILIMFVVGIVRMLDIMVRAICIARMRGCWFWMFGALWDTAFQVAVSPICWAMEKGREGASRIKNKMEAEAAYTGRSRDAGTSDNLEILADWVPQNVWAGVADRSDCRPRARRSSSGNRKSEALSRRGLLH
jgi:hypothetical protein